MRLEDLALVYAGEIALLDRKNQVAVPFVCSPRITKCWAGVIQAPVVSMLFCDVCGQLSAVLDCDSDFLRQFRWKVAARTDKGKKKEEVFS